MVRPAEVAGYGRGELTPRGQQALGHRPVVRAERIAQPAAQFRVVAYEVRGPPHPQPRQNGRDHGHPLDPARVAGQPGSPAVLVHVEGDGAVLHLLRAVPAQQIQHDLVRPGPVEPLGAQHPVPQDRRELLDRGDQSEPEAQPLQRRHGQTERRSLPEQLLEEEVHVPRVRVRRQSLCGEVVQYGGVLHAVRGLLAHEPADVAAQLGVGDQGQAFLEDLYEPALPGGQQQVQHVDDVGGGGFVRYPVQRGALPVEGHPARTDPVRGPAHSRGSSLAMRRRAFGA